MIAVGIIWTAIKRGARGAVRHPWALLVVVGAIVAWVYRALLGRKLADARAQRDAARLEAEVQRGRAEVAEATAAAAARVAANQEAGRALAEEIDRAASPAATPDDRVRLADERVREIARREGAHGGGDRPAAVRDAPAAAAARGAGRRRPER